MAEWLKAAVLKTVKGESSSRVRIPLSPLVENTTLAGGVFKTSEERVDCPAAVYVGIRKTETCRTERSEYDSRVGVEKNFHRKFIRDRIYRSLELARDT